VNKADQSLAMLAYPDPVTQTQGPEPLGLLAQLQMHERRKSIVSNRILKAGRPTSFSPRRSMALSG